MNDDDLALKVLGTLVDGGDPRRVAAALLLLHLVDADCDSELVDEPVVPIDAHA